MSEKTYNLGFMERVLVFKRDKIYGDDNFCTDPLKCPRQSIYLNRLSQLHDQLLMEEEIKLAQDLDRFGLRPVRFQSERNRQKLEYQNINEFLKSPKRSPVPPLCKTQRRVCVRLPPLKTLVQGKKLNGQKKQEKGESTAETNGSSDKFKMNEMIRINLSRLPPQMQPMTPSIFHQDRKHEQLSVQSRAVNGTRTKIKQRYVNVSTKSRLRPFIPQSTRMRDAKSHKLKFEPLTEGARVDVTMLNDYLLFNNIPDTNITAAEKNNLTMNTIVKHTSVGFRKHSLLTKKTTGSSLSFRKPFHTQIYTKKPKVATSTVETIENTSRMRIVVDMPNIILKGASPEPDESIEATPIGVLAKACKQSEIRQKEMRNLLEDLRELNKRSQASVEIKEL